MEKNISKEYKKPKLGRLYRKCKKTERLMPVRVLQVRSAPPKLMDIICQENNIYIKQNFQ